MREMESLVGIAKQLLKLLPFMTMVLIVCLIIIRVLYRFGYYNKFKKRKKR